MKQVTARKATLRCGNIQNQSSGTTFDFEIGTLVQSPCRRCEMQTLLPGCSQRCDLLSRIQSTLAGGISSGHSVSPGESYSLSTADR